MTFLLQPAFFGPIIQYVVMASGEIAYEKQDNFQKQTYRNRCYIYGANGKQLLTVPIRHTKSERRQKTKDLRIDNSFSWKKIVIKSLESSYRSSPFFEFYEDDIMEVFDQNYDYLLDLNLKTAQVISDCLQLDHDPKFTEEYEVNPEGVNDFRHLIDAKHQPVYPFRAYTQVFEKKHGFIGNLSILDLLFNEGTNALDYLMAHRQLFEK